MVAVTRLVAALIGIGRVHPADVLHTLQRIGLRTVVLATVAILAQSLIVMTRLWFLFPSPRPSWIRVAYGFSLGQVVNHLLPVRTGDLVKGMLISGPDSGRSKAQTVGVMIADNLVDLGALMLLVVCVGLGDVVPLGHGLWARLGLVGVVAVPLAIGFLLVRRHARVQRVLDGLQVLRDPAKLVGGLTLSMGNWTAEFLALHWLTADVGCHLGFADAIRVLFLFNLAIVFPISVANVGSFEIPIAIGLRAAGLAFGSGLAIGTAYHGLQILGIVLLAVAMLIVRRGWPTVLQIRRRSGSRS